MSEDSKTPEAPKAPTFQQVILDLPYLQAIHQTMPETEAIRALHGAARTPVFQAAIAFIRYRREEVLRDVIDRPLEKDGGISAETRAWLAGQAEALMVIEQGLIAATVAPLRVLPNQG